MSGSIAGQSIEERLPRQFGIAVDARDRATSWASRHSSARRRRPCLKGAIRNPATSRTTPTTVNVRDSSGGSSARRVSDVRSGSRRIDLADRIGIRPQGARGRFGNDGHRKIRRALSRRERPPAHDRDIEHAEATPARRTCRRPLPLRRALSANAARGAAATSGHDAATAATDGSAVTACTIALRVDSFDDLDDDGVGGPHSRIERGRGKRTSQEHRRRDQQQRRRAHLQANQEISRPSWPRVPDHLAADRPDRFDARGLQRRGEPEEHRRDAGADNEKQQHAPVRVGYRQSDISHFGGHGGHHRVDDRRRAPRARSRSRPRRPRAPAAGSRSTAGGRCGGGWRQATAGCQSHAVAPRPWRGAGWRRWHSQSAG